MGKEVKISVEGLQIGMFVSRLDRPWLETPFELQCVEVRHATDIERIRACCNYVYVDVEQGVTPDARYWILAQNPKPQEFPEPRPGKHAPAADNETENQYRKLRTRTYEDSTDFQMESKHAEQASAALQQEYDHLISDLRRGRQLDLAVVRKGVAAMVESVIRNPSAMLWIAQVKKLDRHSYSRALGTSVWCATFGRHLGLEPVRIKELALGGLLLDVGKCYLPLALLKKNPPLQEKEVSNLRAHVDLGVKALSTLSTEHPEQRLPLNALQMVATHHERADGSGYPQGLANEQIPIFGRIAGIVDTYDAITTERPYGTDCDPRTPHEAIHEIFGLGGTRFQLELVEQFIQTVGLYPTGSLIELSSGEVGVVVANNGLRRLRPTVMLLLDRDKQPLSDFTHIDLGSKPQGPTVLRGLPAGSYGINMKELFLQ